MSCIHFQHVSEKELGLVHVNNIFFFSPPPPSPYFQPPPLSSSFSNLTIGLQKPWDRIPPLLSCHHRLLTLWRPRHHKQHNLQQKYPPTSRRRKVPQKKRPPHQLQTQRSQVSLFVGSLMLLMGLFVCDT